MPMPMPMRMPMHMPCPCAHVVPTPHHTHPILWSTPAPFTPPAHRAHCSIPAYWGPLRNDMLLKIGDVDNDPEFNRAISPLFHIDAITAPLLIGQGANDPRVKQAWA